MLNPQIYMDLMKCFRGSFINHNMELIVHKWSNTYLCVGRYKTELAVKAALLEWLSRPAYKGQPYRSDKRNQEYNAFILKGINDFLGTNFTKDEMGVIYQELGNGINNTLALRFVACDYDFSVLEGNRFAKRLKTVEVSTE